MSKNKLFQRLDLVSEKFVRSTNADKILEVVRMVQDSKSLISSVGFLPLLLKGFQPPTEPFEPDGEWEQTYRTFIVGMLSQPHREWNCAPAGTIQIKRTPKQDGTFTLQVNVVANQGIERHGRGFDRIEAQIVCRNDQFASLISWQRLSWLLTPEKQKAEIGDLGMVVVAKMGGKVKNEQVTLQMQGRERKLKVHTPLTCDWAMIDVVQRLAKSGAKKALQFSMLEELEFLRPNQRLYLREPMEIEVEGQKFRWQRFEQFGDGVLPWTYCLDENNRLILAFSAMKAILLART